MAPDPKASATAFVASFISRYVPSSFLQEPPCRGGDEDMTALCKNLVNAAGPTAADVLYGKEIRSQVDEWLSFAGAAEADRDPVTFSARLRTLDSYLLSRAVLLGTGTTVGLADIALFVSLHGQVAALPPDELNGYPNLLRWIDYVQNKDDESHAYDWIPVVKPKFDPPVASAEPVSKKVASSAQGPSTKNEALSGTPVTTPSQQKRSALEEKGRPDHLKDTKGTGQVNNAAKVQQKEKKGTLEALPSGKAESDNDAKKVQLKEKKDSDPLPKDGFGLEILDIKVGIIKTVKKHPTAETLYVEEIDIGEGSLRQVVSGLAKYLTEDQMLNRRVLVLSNVKPSKLRDVLSSGLVLCTSNDDHSQCEPVNPPKEARVGERVVVAGYEGKPEAVLNPKKKQWDKLYPDLHTDETGVACYKGTPLTTSGGPCTSSIMKGSIR